MYSNWVNRDRTRRDVSESEASEIRREIATHTNNLSPENLSVITSGIRRRYLSGVTIEDLMVHYGLSWNVIERAIDGSPIHSETILRRSR